MIKTFLKSVIIRGLLCFSRLSIGRFIYQQIVDMSMSRTAVVNYRSHQMLFTVPNPLNQYRVSTFATKESETLEWIDSLPEGSILWDVGANIGLYAIYAAKARNCQVYAFEPSVFNLELLGRNIFLNRLQNQIAIIPIALSDQVALNLFKMSSTDWGGALSTFGASFDQSGATLNASFEYRTIGVSMIEAARLLRIPEPKFLKIDVDGIEHFILRGGGDVLNEVESVLVEINDAFTEQAEESARHLMNAGLSLYRKCDLGVRNQYNQWWVRSDSAHKRIHLA